MAPAGPRAGPSVCFLDSGLNFGCRRGKGQPRDRFRRGCVFGGGPCASGSPPAFGGELAGWIAAFYPPMILLTGWSRAENVAMFFLLAFAGLAIMACRNGGGSSWKQLATWFAAGCSLCFATLTRPSSPSILVLGAIGLIVFLLIRRVRPSLFQTVGDGSWKIRLWCGPGVSAGLFGVHRACPLAQRLSGVGWSLSTNNQINYLLGNNPYTPHYKTWHLGESRAMSPQFRAYLSRFSDETCESQR